ncbi:unnamed protein product [Ixodes hexagonus]
MAASVRCVLSRPAQRFLVARPTSLWRPTTQLRSQSGPGGRGDGTKSAGLSDHRTNSYDKWILGLYKKYPRGAVPDFVPQATMEKTRNKARIHLNLILAALTLLGAAVFASWGRRDQRRGLSATKMNQDWHAAQKDKP